MNANDFPAEYLNQQKAQRAQPRAQDSIGGSELLLKDEVYQIVGCAMEVLNGLGHGLHEKPYDNALMLEFGLRKIQFVQ